MTDALLATGAALALAAVGLAGVLVLTVVPLVVALGLAERVGAGPVRWGAASAAASAVGLGCLLVALRHGLGLVPAAVGALSTWAAPVALVLLGGSGGLPRLAGARGRHE